jgi:maleate cis-trans isomerase
MRDGLCRLGLMCPIGGGEYEYHQFAESVDYRVRPYVVVAWHGGGDENHDPAALRQTGAIEKLQESARIVKPLSPDVGVWACTSGSFISGRKKAEAQLEAITGVLGVPATSTSMAFARAAQSLGLRRLAVIASYPRATSTAFTGFLEEFGFEIAKLVCQDAPGGREAFFMALDSFADEARKAAKDADAILIPDTAVAAFPLIEPLEHELQKPVLTANQVTLWDAMRLAGWREPVPGYGRLMSRF